MDVTTRPARQWTNGVLEALGVAASLFSTVALTADVRSDSTDAAVLWAATTVGGAALARTFVGGARLTDKAFTTSAYLLAAMVTYPIGGLVMLLPLGLAAASALATGLPRSSTAKGGAQIVVGAVLLPLGALMSLSLSPLATLGLAIDVSSLVLLGMGLARRWQRRGIAWVAAVSVVVGVQALVIWIVVEASS